MTDLIAHIKNLNAATQAWVDAAPGRWAGMMVEDAAHWNECGVYTAAQFDRYMDECAYSDTYKDVNGFRPRHMADMTNEQLRDALEGLYAEAEEQAKYEAECWAHIDQIEAEDERMAALEDPAPLPYEDEELRWG